MDAKGLNYACTKCHVTRGHQISGRCYVTPAPNKHRLALPRDDGNRLSCEACHSRHPHQKRILNDHTARVACQSCHIPRYARGGIYTKVWWDWSTAGRFTPDGKMIVKKDQDGTLIYHTKKGDMRWARDVVPEYRWYNGSMHYYEAGEKIPIGTREVALNTPQGSPADPASRIFPFKIMRGKQPFDPENRIIAVPHLFGKKGSGAYWADYDWQKSLATGMKEAGLPFSGKVDFIKTEMYWPITHMVAPKEEAVTCAECHRRKAGRLAGLGGFYLPGRDRSAGLDLLAWILIIATAFGILNHAGMRWLIHQKRKSRRG
jgi:octaheme c-type cytochrome (tetrathionate reductase family)